MSITYLNEHNNIIDVESFKILDNALKKDIISLILEKKKLKEAII